MAGLDRGKYNKRVTFRNYPTAADGAGGETEGAPVDFLTTYAHVEDETGNRVFETGEDIMVRRKNIRVFSRQLLIANLKKETRIVYDGKEYAIDEYGFEKEEKRIIKFKAVGA